MPASPGSDLERNARRYFGLPEEEHARSVGSAGKCDAWHVDKWHTRILATHSRVSLALGCVFLFAIELIGASVAVRALGASHFSTPTSVEQSIARETPATSQPETAAGHTVEALRRRVEMLERERPANRVGSLPGPAARKSIELVHPVVLTDAPYAAAGGSAQGSRMRLTGVEHVRIQENGRTIESDGHGMELKLDQLSTTDQPGLTVDAIQ